MTSIDRLQAALAHNLRLLRWRARRLSAGMRHGPASLSRSPVLFGNSVPKSGTHLLAQILSSFPKIGLAVERGMGPILTFERQTGRQRTAHEILIDLHRLDAGDLCFGHVIAAPEILDNWRQDKIAHYFMLRDPRDVVISHAFYIADKATQNVHHAYYKSLTNLEDRIRVSILGRPDWEGNFPDIRARYDLYLGWLDYPLAMASSAEICLLRFEDFLRAREENLKKMLAYAEGRGFQLSMSHPQAIAVLSEAIQPKKSFTFRKGEAGNWREHFTPEHKKLFKDVAGNLLIQLGYEQGLDW